jgi:hypothetical protein
LGLQHSEDLKIKTAVEQYLALEERGYQYAKKLSGLTEDNLPLTSDQIKAATEAFIFYDLVKHGDEIGYAPVLHIAKEEAVKYVPGTEGTVEAKNIHIQTCSLINSGTLTSAGDLKINVRDFVNVRRDYKEIEVVKEQDGFWGDTRTRVFEVRKPQIGVDIIGVNIEIESDGKLLVDGGKIAGVQKVYLVSKKGDVEIKDFVGSHVVHWDISAWASSHGKETAAKALDYYPAEISSGGVIDIKAEVGEFLLQASNVIGAQNVNISGYKGVKIVGEISKHKVKDDSTLFGGKDQEEVSALGAQVKSTDGNVTITAPGGSIEIKGSMVDAPKGTIYLEAKDRIDLGVQSISYTKKEKEAAGGLSIGSTETKIVQTEVQPTVVRALKDITIKAGEDNILEAVLMHSGGSVHIVAGRDNRFKGFAKHTEISTSGWNIGISFPGSNLIEGLMKDGKSGLIGALRDGDPLVSAINRFSHAQDAADKIGESTYVAIEAIRALDQYLKAAEKIGALGAGAGMLGNRLGLTDTLGNFAPRITLHAGSFESRTEMNEIIRTALSAEGDIKITSERDTHINDGTSITGDRIVITAKDIEMTSAKNTIHSESESNSASIGYGAGGFSGSASHSESNRDTLNHLNAEVRGREVEMNAVNLGIHGGEVHGENVTLNIEKDLVVESMQDSDHGSSASMSASFGASDGKLSSGGASFSHGVIDKDRVNVPSGIHASKTLKVVVGNTIHLIGGVLDGTGGATNITATEIKVDHLRDHDDSRSFGASYQFTNGDGDDSDPISSVFDIDYKSRSYEGKTQSTISPEAYLEIKKITDDLQKVNRDLSKIQVGTTDETHLRAVIPTINLEQIQKDMARLRKLVEGPEKEKQSENTFDPYDYFDEDIIDEEPKDESDSKKHKETRETVGTADEGGVHAEIIKSEVESTTIDDQEVTVTPVKLVDADGKSLGKIRVGVYKRNQENSDSEKSVRGTSEETSHKTYVGPNGEQTIVQQGSDGNVYLLQGDEKLLGKYTKWRYVTAEVVDDVISLWPVLGPPVGAVAEQAIKWEFDAKKTAEGVAWGAADATLIGIVGKIEKVGKIGGTGYKVITKVFPSAPKVITKFVKGVKKLFGISDSGIASIEKLTDKFEHLEDFKFYFTTKKGKHIMVKAKTVISDTTKTLTLKHVSIFEKESINSAFELGFKEVKFEKNIVGPGVFREIRSKTAALAKEQGFKELTIENTDRMIGSTSKNPGHKCEWRYDLTKEKISWERINK